MLALLAPGAKAEVDLASTQVVAPGGISVVLPGQESKATMSTTRLTAVRGSVTLMADKDIPYRLLRKVMATAARADFSDVSFAVTQKVAKT